MGLFDRFKSGGDSQIKALIADLKHADPKKRYAAAQKLGELGKDASAAMPALEDAIADDDGDVCLAASDALSKIRRDAH